MKLITNAILKDIVNARNYVDSLSHNYRSGSVMDGAVALAKILLCSAGGGNLLLHESNHVSAFDLWYEKQDKRRQRALSAWMYSFLGYDNWYIFKTFEETSPKREIFDILL